MSNAATPLLLYDGDCGFCTSCANWVAARWAGPARTVPWQFIPADELVSLGVTPDQARSAVWWIEEPGKCSRGHVAIAEALADGSGWSAAVGHVLLVPPFRWLGAAAYPLVARFRHRLPGGTPACRV